MRQEPVANEDFSVSVTDEVIDGTGDFARIDTITVPAGITAGQIQLFITQSTQDLMPATLANALPGTITQPVDQDDNAAVDVSGDSEYSSQPVQIAVEIGATGTIAPANANVTIRGNDANHDRLVLIYAVDTSGAVTAPNENRFMRSIDTVTATGLADTRTVTLTSEVNYDRVRVEFNPKNRPLPGTNVYEVTGGDPSLDRVDDEARINTTLGVWINNLNINITGDSITTSTISLIGLRPYPNENPEQTTEIQRQDPDNSDFTLMPAETFTDWNTGIFRVRNGMKEELDGASANFTYNNNYEARRVLNQTRYAKSIRRANPGFREITLDLQNAAETGINEDLDDFLNNVLIQDLSVELFNAKSGEFPARLDIIAAAGELTAAPQGGIEGSGEITDPLNTRLIPRGRGAAIVVRMDCKLDEWKFFQEDYS